MQSRPLWGPETVTVAHLGMSSGRILCQRRAKSCARSWPAVSIHSSRGSCRAGRRSWAGFGGSVRLQEDCGMDGGQERDGPQSRPSTALPPQDTAHLPAPAEGQGPPFRLQCPQPASLLQSGEVVPLAFGKGRYLSPHPHLPGAQPAVSARWGQGIVPSAYCYWAARFSWARGSPSPQAERQKLTVFT